MAEIGNLNLDCGTCGVPLFIPIQAKLSVDEDGQMYVDTSADVSGLWLHAWTEHLEDEEAWNGWS